jgi:uncharacterized membrane protein YfcA
MTPVFAALVVLQLVVAFAAAQWLVGSGDVDPATMVLFAALAVFAAGFLARWTARREGARTPTWVQSGIGFLTNVGDALGVGSFATTTSIYRMGRLVPDELIPGTLNVGHTLPVVAQAFIFIAIITVDMTTLVSMIAVAIVGAYLGATVVSRLPRRPIRLGMGTGLLFAALFMLMANLGWFPAGGTAPGLTGATLLGALVVNAFFGALVPLGIGNYAPTLIFISLLGMDPRAAFPIMMGSAAFMMCAASLKFVAAARYHQPAALGLTMGGIPGVLLAGLLIKSLPLEAVRWMVVVVVVYTAFALLRDALVPAPSLPAVAQEEA